MTAVITRTGRGVTLLSCSAQLTMVTSAASLALEGRIHHFWDGN